MLKCSIHGMCILQYDPEKEDNCCGNIKIKEKQSFAIWYVYIIKFTFFLPFWHFEPLEE